MLHLAYVWLIMNYYPNYQKCSDVEQENKENWGFSEIYNSERENNLSKKWKKSDKESHTLFKLIKLDALNNYAELLNKFLMLALSVRIFLNTFNIYSVVEVLYVFERHFIIEIWKWNWWTNFQNVQNQDYKWQNPSNDLKVPLRDKSKLNVNCCPKLT